MKKCFLLAAVIYVVVGCQESLPPVNMELVKGLVYDTTMRVPLSQLPSADNRVLLIEDVTGVRCTGCPNAAQIAADIKDNSTAGGVVIVGVYPTTPKSLTTYISPYEDLFYQARLTSELSQLIAQNIYMVGGTLPGGGLNRKILDGKINVDYNTWLNHANSLKYLKAIVNLETNLSFINDSTAKLRSRALFVGDAESVPYVTIFLIEDNIKYPQYFVDSTSYSYKHKHVLREAYTPYNGLPLLTNSFTSAERGVAIDQEWNLVIPKHVVQENASIVIMINYNDGANQEVIQCREIKLK